MMVSSALGILIISDLNSSGIRALRQRPLLSSISFSKLPGSNLFLLWGLLYGESFDSLCSKFNLETLSITTEAAIQYVSSYILEKLQRVTIVHILPHSLIFENVQCALYKNFCKFTENEAENTGEIKKFFGKYLPENSCTACLLLCFIFSKFTDISYSVLTVSFSTV